MKKIIFKQIYTYKDDRHYEVMKKAFLGGSVFVKEKETEDTLFLIDRKLLGWTYPDGHE